MAALLSIKKCKHIYILGNFLSATDVIQFWFEDIEPKQRFIKDLKFDEALQAKFSETHHLAAQGLLYAWREHPLDALAEIIVLDQFSRNIFRDTPKAFATDTLALVLAQEAIRKKFDKELDNSKRSFLYMPFMHSESKEIHDIALFLFDQPGLEDNFNFEVKHKTIIDRFGRYPHRNEILGRESTAEELEFLSQPGSSF
ncbi:MAG: hypothetical protein COB20_11395 [SAR86 cluster bacterium]|uniref:DUF924 domain-containing protein n=1 Tax=SAR86 cluster bacterium TaxID=2030880 RepID=A0A2A4X064_9GAMM|nr:MAG: hypothetical protein COB20_11395 [SAR86 cluster bacterium]